jgi:hypothetical protein
MNNLFPPMSTNEILNKLRAPFPADRIEWRLQSCGKKNDGSIWGRCLAYIDNRAAMERLDDVFGPTWSHTEEFKQIGEKAVCTVTISIDLPSNEGGNVRLFQRTVSGSCEVEANGDIDPFKSAASGAMKRAVVNLGIGRYLYDLPEGWAEVSSNGKYQGMTKERERFRWNPPQLPDWASAGGSGSSHSQRPENFVEDSEPAPAPAPKAKAVPFKNDFKKETNAVIDAAVKVAVAAPAEGAGYGPAESAMVVPFGRNKGKTLGDLSIEDLNYWANVWEPKPWEKTGKVGPKDTKLKAAAKAMYAARTGGTAKPSVPADLEVPAYEEPADDVPF